MKFKPFVKRHWLASQNPMTLPLQGLKRVVFTPPVGVVNAEFAGSADTAVKLAPRDTVRTLLPEAGEIRDFGLRSAHNSRDVFWNVFSAYDLDVARAPAHALKRLANSVEFHFTDGQILALPGIFRREGFPLFLDPRFYLRDRNVDWARALERVPEEVIAPLKILDSQKRSEEFKKSWYLILEILAWAMERRETVGDLEVLCAQEGQDFGEERTAHRLDNIEFFKAHPLAATVRAVADVENTAQISIWQGSKKLAPPGILQLFASGVLAQLEYETPRAGSDAELEALREHAGQLTWEPLLTLRLAQGEALTKELSRLEKILGERHVLFVGHACVRGSGFKPQVQVREFENALQVAVSFRVESEGLRYVNFPSSLRPALKPFLGGLARIFSVDRKDVASRKIQYRTADLLFLRHQGVTLFCLLELLNWQLHKPLTTGQVIDFVEDPTLPEADTQFEKFVEYLQGCVPSVLGKAGSTFQEIFSVHVREMFYTFIESTYHALRQDRGLIFRGQRMIEVRDVQRETLPLLRFVLLFMAESSGGKLLTRTQAPVGERLQAMLTPWTEPQVQELDALLEPFWVELGVFNKAVIPLLFELSDSGVQIEFNGKPFSSEESPFEFLFTVGDSENNEGGNWFDLHPQIFFNGQPVRPEEVNLGFASPQVGFVEYRGQIFRIDKAQLPSLKALRRFWKRLHGQTQSSRKGHYGEVIYRMEKSQALELLMLKTQGIPMEVSGEMKRIFDYFESGLGIHKIILPDGMHDLLLAHQRSGAQWLHDLYELRLGAILADEMGLGKTFQVLSFLVSLQLREKLKKTLVIVPTSLVYNWVDEKKKFAAHLPLRVFQSAEVEDIQNTLDTGEPLVLLATYGLLLENPEFFQKQDWSVVVFDEAQNLKNINSQRSLAARKLKAEFKICLTGTPMENNYLEFFSLCDLVVPGCLGPLEIFRRRYYNVEVSAEALHELRLVSKPLLLRRTKLQVKLTLPPKTVQRVLLNFTPKQKDIYKKMALVFSRQVEDLIEQQGEAKARIAMLTALMRLRQICSDPSAVPGVVYDERPVKIEHFMRALEEHLENGDSVIVFTQFLTTLSRLEAELTRMGVPAFVLQGKVAAKERIRLISEFQNHPQPSVMLMTLKTGGVGLNLTKASIVYHLEPWWNPAVENQASDRAHRMGQTREVTVYNLLIEGSLEERIADLKVRKQGSFDRLFNAEDEDADANFEGANALSREDFLYLLK